MRQTREQFVRYLRETLIPDLKESGSDYTAADFEAACRFIERPNLKATTINVVRGRRKPKSAE